MHTPRHGGKKIATAKLSRRRWRILFSKRVVQELYQHEFCIKSNTTTEVSFFDCLDKMNSSLVEDLYHEYEDLDWSSFPESIVVPVLFGIVFFAGLMGNGIVLFVVARSGFASKKNITNLYFGNLALADLCFLIVCVPTTAMTYLLPIVALWPTHV